MGLGLLWDGAGEAGSEPRALASLLCFKRIGIMTNLKAELFAINRGEPTTGKQSPCVL